MGTSSSWTPERRERQRQAIHCWRPWERSTGPRTKEGKARSAQNAKRPADLLEVEAYMKLLALRTKRLKLLLRLDPRNRARLAELETQIAAMEQMLDPTSEFGRFLAESVATGDNPFDLM